MIFDIIDSDTESEIRFIWIVLLIYFIVGFPITLVLLRKWIVTEVEYELEQVEEAN